MTNTIRMLGTIRPWVTLSWIAFWRHTEDDESAKRGSAVIAAGEVPLWATLLVGVAGGVLGALFTIRHERGAEFRTRMLDAADDFLRALTAASRHVADVRNLLVNEERPSERDVDAVFRQLDVARDQVLSTLPRIDLLFGRETPTWTSGSSAYEAIQDAVASLRGLRAGERGATNLLMFQGDRFEVAINEFGAAVRADVRGNGSRYPHSIQRVRAELHHSTARLNRWLHQLRLRLAR